MSDHYALIPTRSKWATLYFRTEDLLQALTCYYAVDLPGKEAKCLDRTSDAWGRVFSSLHPALNHAFVDKIPELKIPQDTEFFTSAGERLPPLTALTISAMDVDQLRVGSAMLSAAALTSPLGEALAHVALHGAMAEAQGGGPTTEDFNRSLSVLLLRPGLELLLRVRGHSGREPIILSAGEEAEYRNLWNLIGYQLGDAGALPP